MATIVSGTFAERAAAQIAVERLCAAGVPAADISLIVRDTETLREAAGREADLGEGRAAPPVAEEVAPVTAAVSSEAPSATVKGAKIGGIGGLLIGLGALTVPGSAPVVAAAPLVAALGGAAAGAAAGGLVGALVDLGVPEEHATVHVSDVERGHVLVTVRTDAASQRQVRELMADAGALSLHASTISG
jgi:hypothetical protein